MLTGEYISEVPTKSVGRDATVMRRMGLRSGLRAAAKDCESFSVWTVFVKHLPNFMRHPARAIIEANIEEFTPLLCTPSYCIAL